MLRTDHCKICHTLAGTIPAVSPDETYQNCPRCGEFNISRIDRYQMLDDEGYCAKLSGWVYDQNRRGAPPTLTYDVLERVAAQPLLTFEERAYRLLLEAVQGQDNSSDGFNVNEPRFIAATYSQSTKDVVKLLNLLTKRGLMKSVAIGGRCEVLPEGYVKADELKRKPVNSAKVFVAMWFNESMDPAYENGFQPGIRNAGYQPFRIDEPEHIEKIDDKILDEIKSSAFVIADLTGHRGGVYFEAGFAMGLGLKVVWSCRKDHMDDRHFDIRQYNCIEWKEPEELAKKLQRRIEEVFGKGPKTVS